MQITKINKIGYLAMATFAIAFLPFHVSHADISQTDYSVYGGSGYINGYVQTLGQLSGTQIQTLTLRLHSTTASPYNVAQARILVCTDQYCDNPSIVGEYYAYTSSARSAELTTIFTAGGYDGTVSFNFQYAKNITTGSSTTYVPIDSTKYYAIWFYSNDGNVSRYEGSSNSSSYPYGACYVAAAIYSSSPSASSTYPCISYSTYAISDAYFVINGITSIPPPPSSGSTQFISVTPSLGSVIATTSMQAGVGNPTNTQGSASTTITASTYISPADFATGISLQADLIINAGVDANAGFTTNIMTFNFTATSSGYVTFSTTTPLISEGASKIEFTLSVNNAAWYCLWLCGGTTYSTTTVFTVGTSTQADIDNATTLGDVAGIEQAINATTTLGACNILGSFDIAGCLVNLIIPSTAQVQSSMQSFYNNFLTKAPWGYGTIIIADIMGYGNDATSSLSASNLTITLPNTGIFATATSTSLLKGKTLTFIDWSQIASSTVQAYWAPATGPLNNFFNLIFAAGFSFWLYHFFKKMNP